MFFLSRRKKDGPVAGLDVGSRFVKACVAENGRVAGCAVLPASRDMEAVIAEVLEQAARKSGTSRRRLGRIIATGAGSGLMNGRYPSVPAGRAAHAGARTLCPGVLSVLDAGGLYLGVSSQNSLTGRADFVSNERCAAGSGKFLEMVAKALGVGLADVSEKAMASKEPYSINATCAVFAESEVVNAVNAGMDAGDILAGVIFSIASRAVSLLEKADAKGPLAMVGGLAQVPAFTSRVARISSLARAETGIDPAFVTAYGAAILADENL